MQIYWKERVFGQVVHTLEGVKPVAYKWILCERINEMMKKKIVRCKRVVAQNFSQRPEIVIRNTSSCGGSINFQVSIVWQELKATGK